MTQSPTCSKLSDLHKAGILTDEEFEAKGRKSSAEPRGT